MVITVEKHKIAYMALPKAACSSVKAALAQIDDQPRDDGGFTCDLKWHSMYPTRRFRPHRWEQYGEDWYRFCVVRDPVQRLISCYLDRVVERRELFNSRNVRLGWVSLPAMPDPDFFLQNIQAYKGVSSTIKHHAMPSWLFLGKNLSLYDDVFTPRQLPALGAILSERSGQPVVIPRENATAKTTKLTLDDLRPQTVDILKKSLAEEYSFLSNYLENPFDKITTSQRAA